MWSNDDNFCGHIEGNVVRERGGRCPANLGKVLPLPLLGKILAVKGMEISFSFIVMYVFILPSFKCFELFFYLKSSILKTYKMTLETLKSRIPPPSDPTTHPL